MLRRHGLVALTGAALVAVLAGGLVALPGGAQSAADGRDAARSAASDAATAKPAASDAATGKPVAPFEIESSLDGPVALGVPVDLRIRVGAPVPLDDIEVRLTPDAGLVLDASDLVLSAPSAAPEHAAEWRITIVPVETGVLRLRLYAEALVRGARQGRSEVVTLRVGAAGEPDP